LKDIHQTNVDQEMADLLAKAKSVAKHAYNPLSHFHVGAAVLASTGEIFLGTFFESSSAPVGVCAEQVAIGAAITSGCRQFRAIAIVGGAKLDEVGTPVKPCGKCRQTIADFAEVSGAEIVIVCGDMSLSRVEVTAISALLPDPFVLPITRRS
jgi:cytidine deaminase